MKTAAFEITAEITAVRPDYKPLARTLLEEIRTFFSDPENEADYQRWLMERKKVERRKNA